MADQAQGLRVLAKETRRAIELEHSAIITTRRTAQTIAVTSGKGGVGKTNFSANLALTLARSGKRVILLDADLGLANLHVLFGVSPAYRLEHVIRGEKALSEILCPVAEGVSLIAGGSGVSELANLTETERRRFVTSLSALDAQADIILIDTGAGLSKNVLAFVLAAEEVILITTPEPTAIADAYGTIKVVTRESSSPRLRLVVNMAATGKEATATAERLRMVCRRFLEYELEILGSIPVDAAIPRSVRAQRPVLLDNPAASCCGAMSRIAESLGFGPTRQAGVNGFLNRLTRHFGVC